MRVGLVGCTKSKRPGEAPARDLYDPSTLFRGRRAYVERTCDRWFVLSSLYGLVDPDAVIRTYDVTLKSSSVAERRAWSDRVLGSLQEQLGDLRAVEFECHAGAEYLNFGVADGLRRLGAVVTNPTQGLRLGQQLAFYAATKSLASSPLVPVSVAVPARPDLASLPAGLTSVLDPTEILAALLSFGNSLDAGTLVAIGPDPESDELIRADGFAFLLAVVFDQGIKYERAWRAPYELKQRLGYLDPGRIVADPDAVRRAVASPPALHRYVNNLPSWIVACARRVLDEYGGDAERIWNDSPTAADLRQRLERFQGIGQKKAAMAVEILERQRGTAIRHLEGSDIAFDVHVRRVFLRTGLVERDDQHHMVEAARRLHPARPGALDYPAWWVGHEWCRPVEPACGACPLGDVCPRLVSHASSVAGA